MNKVYQTIKNENLKSIEFKNDGTIPFYSSIFKINGIEISEYGRGVMDIVLELPANSNPKVTIIGHREKMSGELIKLFGLEDELWEDFEHGVVLMKDNEFKTRLL